MRLGQIVWKQLVGECYSNGKSVDFSCMTTFKPKISAFEARIKLLVFLDAPLNAVDQNHLKIGS